MRNQMRYHRIFHILVLSIILSLVVASPTIPAYAAGENIHLSPKEGEIDDKIDIEGDGFEAKTTFRIYFSSDAADEGEDIDTEVTSYYSTGIKWTDVAGEFVITFTVPSQLFDGEDKEDVHGGNYYFYLFHSPGSSFIYLSPCQIRPSREITNITFSIPPTVEKSQFIY